MVNRIQFVSKCCIFFEIWMHLYNHVYQLFWWCELFHRRKPKLKFLFNQYNKFTWTTSCCLNYVSFKHSFKPSKNVYHNPFPIHSPISQGARGGTNKMKCCTVSTSVPCVACHRLPARETIRNARNEVEKRDKNVRHAYLRWRNRVGIKQVKRRLIAPSALSSFSATPE